MCQLVSCPRVVTHTLPSVSPRAHKHTPMSLIHLQTHVHAHTQVPARWMTGGSSPPRPPSPHGPPRPHTDSPRHLRQLPPSQRKDSGPTSGHNQQLRRSVRHRPTPQPQLHLGKHCRAGTEHAAARLYTSRQGKVVISSAVRIFG